MQKQVITRPGGTPKWTRDATANDSDKTFTVPTGKEWELLRVFGQLAATATVGNRVLEIHITNGTDRILFSSSGPVATANQLCVNEIWFGTGGPTAFNTTAHRRIDSNGNDVNTARIDCYGKVILPAGYAIRIWDIGAIDAAADDLICVLHYIEYEA